MGFKKCSDSSTGVIDELGFPYLNPGALVAGRGTMSGDRSSGLQRSERLAHSAGLDPPIRGEFSIQGCRDDMAVSPLINESHVFLSGAIDVILVSVTLDHWPMIGGGVKGKTRPALPPNRILSWETTDSVRCALKKRPRVSRVPFPAS
jgi:hypothetical protein